LARGKSRSDSLGHVLENVRTLAEKGIQEVVLTGVNLGDFGNTDPITKRKAADFFELTKALDQVKEMPRFRISSIEPNLLINDIIDLVANSDRFMPHFHIPLQSGSNKILALARGVINVNFTPDRVAKIKMLMPHAAIQPSVIGGFQVRMRTSETLHFLHEQSLLQYHSPILKERKNTEH
jgi:threonylcarbamoyladenosine tRNA methylthiotransferase MtaB